MKILLTSEKAVKDVQQEFQKAFPFLKIEFFKRPHHEAEGSPASELVPPSMPLVWITGVLREGEIEIQPAEKVKDVEERFQNKFYLPVQVFRRNRDVWLETITTDYLSLAEQNEMGRNASESTVFKPEKNSIDWDEIL